MEVHHHPDMHHSPKPWKEYLLEFFMIFLAVTMGFFAESLREHITDHEKEHQYMESFLQDLKTDSVLIQQNIEGCIFPALQMDTFASALIDYKPSDSLNRKLYEYYMNSTYIFTFYPNERTLNQMNNTGSMRLIKKENVANAIADYMTSLDHLKDYDKVYNEWNTKSVEQALNIFNISYLKFYVGRDDYAIDTTSVIDTSLVIDPVYRNQPLTLMTTDEFALRKYANSIRDQQIVSLDLRQVLMDFREQQNDLIELLEKEYDLTEPEK